MYHRPTESDERRSQAALPLVCRGADVKPVVKNGNTSLQVGQEPLPQMLSAVSLPLSSCTLASVPQDPRCIKTIGVRWCPCLTHS